MVIFCLALHLHQFSHSARNITQVSSNYAIHVLMYIQWSIVSVELRNVRGKSDVGYVMLSLKLITIDTFGIFIFRTRIVNSDVNINL